MLEALGNGLAVADGVLDPFGCGVAAASPKMKRCPAAMSVKMKPKMASIKVNVLMMALPAVEMASWMDLVVSMWVVMKAIRLADNEMKKARTRRPRARNQNQVGMFSLASAVFAITLQAGAAPRRDLGRCRAPAG
ncbi:hypothetical protein GCM10017771_84570 [Streptomyces capitiformicae]|uniref:Uncharacterized protein n=1 Tax=Streptomyces capitiformicae TaxID=2014920 RepID=A0A918ZN44_9ACTN|nr:hypothetical protein GCM10017771_84570 [Streptomyces capitiformicae]